MKKPYILIATVNGADLPAKHYATSDEAYLAMNRLMDRYNLQLEAECSMYGDHVYRMEQYRTWFRIRCAA